MYITVPDDRIVADDLVVDVDRPRPEDGKEASILAVPVPRMARKPPSSTATIMESFTGSTSPSVW